MKEVACIAVIHNGKMLMGKRRDNGKYTMPGGHLETLEDPSHGAIRELEEEAGISAEVLSLKHLKTKLVTKKNGEQLKVHAYRLDLDERTPTSMKQDPDGEVHRWHWFNMHALPAPLHVPFEDNVILQALGEEVSMKKVAFWVGFEKAAMIPSLNPVSAIAAKAKPLVQRAWKGVDTAGRKAYELGKAHPKAALGLGAAGAAGAGFAAGRASK